MFYGARIQLDGTVMDPSKVDRVCDGVYRQQLTGAGLFIQGEVQRNTPFGVTGAMQKAWFTEYHEDEQQAVVSNPSEYILAVELGRKAAPVPIEPIRLWARRKLQLSERAAARAAFFIARKKRRQATPGQFFARDAFEGSIQTVNDMFLQPIGAELVKGLSQ